MVRVDRFSGSAEAVVAALLVFVLAIAILG
jgi:hypothetical protein